jgi:hypothetical protein
MPHWSHRLTRFTAIVGAALLFCWPALWNGYPLLIPDCITYVASGRRAILLFLGDRTVSNQYLRSPIYSAGIYPFHLGVTAWPVIAMQAVLAAWVLWLVVRSLCTQRSLTVYLSLTVVLSALSTLAWFVSLLMPDILGPILYLCLYLLVFAAPSLQRWETVLVALIVLWTVPSHGTHILLALSLCVLFGLLWAMRWQPMQNRGAALLKVVCVVLLSLLAQVVMNARIYHHASLFDPSPPYLTARLVADGPAQDYLKEHCGTLHWTLCKHLDHLPWDEVTFLWATDGIYQTSTPQERQEISAEELPLLIGTLRSHPRQQAIRSWHNFIVELTDFGPEDTTNGNPWMIAMLDKIFPGESARYQRSPQFKDALQRRFFRNLQQIVAALSAMLILLLLPSAWRSRQEILIARLLGLTAIVLFIALANAALTGIISGQASRYQGRVAWLLPMLAFLMAYQLFAARQESKR